MKKQQIRLILRILLLSFIPLFLFAFFSYQRIHQQMHAEDVARLEQSLRQQINVIERLLSHTQVSADSFLETSSIQESMSDQITGRDYQLYRDIRKELLRLQPFDAVNTDACLISFKGNWLINNAGLYTLDDVEHLDKYQQYFNSNYVSKWIMYKAPESTAEKEGYDLFFAHDAVHMVKSIPVGKQTNISGLLLVKIPVKYLQQLIDENQDTLKFAVLDENGNLITGTQKITDAELEESYKARQKLNSHEMLHFSLVAEKEEAALLQSDYSNWTYISLMPRNEMSSRYLSLTMTIVIICLVIFLFLLVGASILAQRIYKPVGALIETLNTPGYSNKSDPFEYISSEIGNLRKGYSTLVEKLTSQQQPVREYVTIACLLGNENHELTEKQNELFPECNDTDQKAVLVFQPNASALQEDAHSFGAMMSAMQKTAENLFPKKYVMTPVMIEQSLCMILRFQASPDQASYISEAKDVATRLLEIVSTKDDMMFTVGIGRPYQQIKDCSKSYQEALRAISYGIFYQGESILPYEALSLSRSLHPLHYKNIEEKLISAIKTADRENTHKYLDNWFSEIFQEGLSRNEGMVLLMNLLTELIILNQEITPEFSTRRDNNQSLYDELMDCSTRDQMEDWLYVNMINPYIDKVSALYSSQQRQIVIRIQNMIEQNYDQDLTLEKIADDLNYHPAYLRKVFSECTGKTFTDCLNAKKIEVAMQWLSDSDMKIQDMAERLGYSNSQNFIRYFKAYTGVTPGQFRKTNQIKEPES